MVHVLYPLSIYSLLLYFFPFYFFLSIHSHPLISCVWSNLVNTVYCGWLQPSFTNISRNHHFRVTYVIPSKNLGHYLWWPIITSHICLIREVMSISIAFSSLFPPLSHCKALCILWALDRLTHIIDGSSWVL